MRTCCRHPAQAALPACCLLLPLLLLLLLPAPLLSPALASPPRQDGDAAAGARIYRDGVFASGAPLRGAGVNGMLREGKDAACVGCHRHSGFGSAEGPFAVRPITADDLFQIRAPVAASARIAHQLGKPARPPYDNASLGAALRSGVDASGRTLDGLMPRYALTAADLRDLAAYLRTLGARAPGGVDDQDIHFATVIQPGVAAPRRAALLAVLEAFVRDKNAAVRSEPARRRAGAMRMQRAYRRWVLHVWELNGRSEEWQAQLDEHYRAQPVFALVSGLGDQNWAPIHQFSERRRLPCILPLALLPAVALPNFYTVYFSGGLLLEAEGLARHLAASGQGSVTQVYRSGDAAGEAAAATLRRALARSGLAVTDQVLPARSAAAPKWGGRGDAATVLWLGGAELAGAAPAPASPVFLAQALVPDALPPGWESALRVSRWDSGPAHAQRLRRARDWMTARAIPIDDEEVQVNALFAMSMLGEALMHMLDSFSREYLIEQVEHNVNVTVLPSMYPHLSLGRDMRLAAHEVYLGHEARPLSASDPEGGH